jgi:hypothetical protein
LQHDNLISVLDCSSDGAESPFLVMELLEGETLRARLDRVGALPLDEALELGRQLCRGMGYAHEHGIVHRDLKPENLMLTRRSDGQPWLKVLDFGVACWTRSTEPQLTSTGVELGTAYYMSPEQARGQKGVDAQTDVFSIGAILYEMSTGQRVQRGSSYNEVLFHLLTQPHRPLREALPGCPSAWVEIVERCLSKAAAQRYRDAGELLAALESLPRASVSADVAPGSRPPRARRVASYLALGLGLGAACGGSIAWNLRGHTLGVAPSRSVDAAPKLAAERVLAAPAVESASLRPEPRAAAPASEQPLAPAPPRPAPAPAVAPRAAPRAGAKRAATPAAEPAPAVRRTAGVEPPDLPLLVDNPYAGAP